MTKEERATAMRRGTEALIYLRQQMQGLSWEESAAIRKMYSDVCDVMVRMQPLPVVIVRDDGTIEFTTEDR